jgi:MYXO-CTERM domain-containing protein
VTRYIDSVRGDDSRSGLSEAEAVKSQAKIGSTCTIVKHKRGSVFPEEAVKISNKVKVYTNYGDASFRLPRFEKRHSPNNESTVSSYQSGITIDGLYLAGFEYGSTEVLSLPPSSLVPISATGRPAGNGASGGCSCRLGPAASRVGLRAGLIGLALLTLRRASRRRSSRRRRTACAAVLLLS